MKKPPFYAYTESEMDAEFGATQTLIPGALVAGDLSAVSGDYEFVQRFANLFPGSVIVRNAGNNTNLSLLLWADRQREFEASLTPLVYFQGTRQRDFNEFAAHASFVVHASAATRAEILKLREFDDRDFELVIERNGIRKQKII
jgi:hypothetical protein